MSDVLWRLDNVGLKGNYLPRIKGVSLEICQGVTAVIGCSGAGKTSLLNLLVGFEVPDQGKLCPRLAGEGHSLPLYWVPEKGGLWPHLTACQHLHTVMPAEIPDERIPNILASFDIADKADSYPDQLSQGEQSRLAVARALAADAAVLVMDEPLISVDQARIGRYWEVIRRHIDRRGTSLVFATHSAEAVLAEADRVVCLKEGRLLYQGKVDELYWHPSSPELAACLGETNWLEADEARLWLHRFNSVGCCYRPEQISIERARQSPIVVKSSHFKGSVAEVELLHEPAGRVRRFYHRPPSNRLHPGDRVLVRVIFFMLLVLLLVGCRRQEPPPMLVKAIHYWQMPADGPTIPAPRAVAVGRAGEVFVTDTAGRLLVFDQDGRLDRYWRMPDTEVGNPEGVCVLKDGMLAVSDTHYHRIVFFDEKGNVLGTLGQEGEGPGQFIYPVKAVEDERGNLYVCEYGSNDRIQKFTRRGKFLLAFGGFGTRAGQFQRPSGMVWHDGKVYVADAVNNRIQVFSDSGKFLKILGLPGKRVRLHFPYDMALGPDGALYVVEYSAGRISKVGLDGKLLGRFGSTGRGERQFLTPWGIAIDAKMHIFVADTGNRRIVELEL